MSDDHREDEEFDDELIPEQKFPKKIYEGNLEKNVPADFDAVTIYLEGGVRSPLNWKNQREQALKAVENGFSIMWDFDLGLIDHLPLPLANEGQFLSLTLAFEHFRDTLWSEFKSETVGVSLFRGSADFTRWFPWDKQQEENLQVWLLEAGLKAMDLKELSGSEAGRQVLRLYCRDVVIEYLAMLAARLPDRLLPYLFLDIEGVNLSVLDEMQLLNPERFEYFNLAIKGNKIPIQAIGWRKPTSQGYSGVKGESLPSESLVTVGVCIPPMYRHHPRYFEGLEDGVKLLQENKISFKLIAESHLTLEWDGLDYLLYCPAGLTDQGKRRLQGFCAAGGTAISVGELIALPHEILLDDFIVDYSLSSD